MSESACCEPDAAPPVMTQSSDQQPQPLLRSVAGQQKFHMGFATSGRSVPNTAPGPNSARMTTEGSGRRNESTEDEMSPREQAENVGLGTRQDSQLVSIKADWSELEGAPFLSNTTGSKETDNKPKLKDGPLKQEVHVWMGPWSSESNVVETVAHASSKSPPPQKSSDGDVASSVPNEAKAMSTNAEKKDAVRSTKPIKEADKGDERLKVDQPVKVGDMRLFKFLTPMFKKRSSRMEGKVKSKAGGQLCKEKHRGCVEGHDDAEKNGIVLKSSGTPTAGVEDEGGPESPGAVSVSVEMASACLSPRMFSVNMSDSETDDDEERLGTSEKEKEENEKRQEKREQQPRKGKHSSLNRCATSETIMEETQMKENRSMVDCSVKHAESSGHDVKDKKIVQSAVCHDGIACTGEDQSCGLLDFVESCDKEDPMHQRPLSRQRAMHVQLMLEEVKTALACRKLPSDLLHWVARFVALEGPTTLAISFYEAIGAPALLRLISSEQPSVAAAATMTVAAFCRDKALAGQFLQAGALPSLVSLLKRANPECTVPAIARLLVNANVNGSDSAPQDTRQDTASVLLSLIEILLGGKAVGALPEEAWALACLSVWPDAESQRRGVEGLAELSFCLLDKWCAKDRAQSKTDRQAIMAPPALEPPLSPWFSVFSVSAMAASLGVCWALSTMMTPPFQIAGRLCEDWEALATRALMRLLQAIGELRGGNATYARTLTVLNLVGRHGRGRGALVVAGAPLQLAQLLEVVPTALTATHLCLLLRLTQHGGARARREVWSVSTGTALVLLASGRASDVAELALKLLAELAEDVHVGHQILAVDGLSKSVSEGLYEAGPTCTASMELLAALCRGCGEHGVQLSREVAQLQPALLRALISACVAVRRMERAGGQRGLEDACDGGCAESASLLGIADQAGHAADVVAAFARHSEPSDAMLKAIPHLLSLARVRTMYTLQASAISSIAALAAHTVSHSELVHHDIHQLLQSELDAVAGELGQPGADAAVAASGPAVVAAWMLSTLASSQTGRQGMDEAGSLVSATRVLAALSRLASESDLTDSWRPLSVPILRALTANATSDAVSEMTVISLICDIAVRCNDKLVTVEAMACLAAISDTDEGAERLADNKFAATVVLVYKRLTFAMSMEPGTSKKLMKSLLSVTMASVKGASSVGEAGGASVAANVLQQRLRSADNAEEAKDAAVLLCMLARVPNGAHWLLEGGTVEPLLYTALSDAGQADDQRASDSLREAALTALAISVGHVEIGHAVLATQPDILARLLSLIGQSEGGESNSSVPILAADVLFSLVENRLVSGDSLAEANGASSLTALLYAALQSGARESAGSCVRLMWCICAAGEKAREAMVTAKAISPLLALQRLRPPGQDTLHATRCLQYLTQSTATYNGQQVCHTVYAADGLRCLLTLLGDCLSKQGVNCTRTTSVLAEGAAAIALNCCEDNCHGERAAAALIAHGHDVLLDMAGCNPAHAVTAAVLAVLAGIIAHGEVRRGMKVDRLASIAVAVLELQRPASPTAITASLDIMTTLAKDPVGREAMHSTSGTMNALCSHLKGVAKASLGIPSGSTALLSVFLGLKSDELTDTDVHVSNHVELRALLLRRPGLQLVRRTLTLACELSVDPASLEPMHNSGCIAALIVIFKSLTARYMKDSVAAIDGNGSAELCFVVALIASVLSASALRSQGVRATILQCGALPNLLALLSSSCGQQSSMREPDGLRDSIDLHACRILACLAATETGAEEIVSNDGVAVLCNFLTGPAAPSLCSASGGASMADASVAAAVVIANLSRLQPAALTAKDHAASAPPVLSALMLMMHREQRCAASTAAATVAATALAELTRGCEPVCSHVSAMGGTDMLVNHLQGDNSVHLQLPDVKGVELDGTETTRLELLQGLAVDNMLLPCHTLLKPPADKATRAKRNATPDVQAGVEMVHSAKFTSRTMTQSSLALSGIRESASSRHYQRREEYRSCVETPDHHVARVALGASSRSSPLNTARLLSTLSPFDTARHRQSPRQSSGSDSAASGTDSSVMSMYDSFCADHLTSKLDSQGDLSVDPF